MYFFLNKNVPSRHIHTFSFIVRNLILILLFQFTDCGDSANRSQVQVVKAIKCYDPTLSYMDRVVMEIVETERVYATDLGEIISVRFYTH